MWFSSTVEGMKVQSTTYLCFDERRTCVCRPAECLNSVIIVSVLSDQTINISFLDGGDRSVPTIETK